MVVADNYLDALGAGIFHFVNGLDTAVQGDDQADAVISGPVQGFVGQAVAFVVAVRNVELYLGGELLDKGVYLGHRRGAVYVIVSVNQDFLPADDGLVQALHGFVHIRHQEGIVQVFQAGTEETTGLFEGVDATLDQ